ncbi:beta-lactamase family protein [Chloroflexales bacterium ZM16-3]|nr:beta-lactamase family protein [Chloroflexales bacterium ZM16-3]
MARAPLHRSLLPLLMLLMLIALPTAPAAARSPTALPAASTLGPDLVADLDHLIEAARADTGAPGALIAVALPNGDVYRSARGVADSTTGTPLTPDARVRVGSITKPFVAAVALQLVQEGWLLLDHSVAHWLPGLVPGGEQITVRQLLSHTSGVPDYLTDDLIARAHQHPDHQWTPQELVAEALHHPQLFAPGAPGRWAYSNTNYILLGLIIEQVTHHTLEQELQQRIITPLGLSGTALSPPSADPGDIAHGYGGGEDRTALNMSVAWAAGGLSATVTDLTRFTQGLVWGALLQPATLNRMLACTPTGSEWGGADFAYGLGVMQRTLPAPGLPPEARLALGHTGLLEGYRSAMWYFPSSGVTIAAAFTREEADPNQLVTGALQVLAAHGALAQPAASAP